MGKRSTAELQPCTIPSGIYSSAVPLWLFPGDIGRKKCHAGNYSSMAFDVCLDLTRNAKSSRRSGLSTPVREACVSYGFVKPSVILNSIQGALRANKQCSITNGVGREGWLSQVILSNFLEAASGLEDRRFSLFVLQINLLIGKNR